MPDATAATDPHDDAARLATEARDGDQDAFDRLVSMFQRRAVAVAYRLLGNTHDAGDVAQDAFIRAYQNIGKLEDPRRFGPWLMRIVTNLSLNYRRSRSRSSAMSTDDMIEGIEQLRTASGATLTETTTAETASAAKELQKIVKQAIDELPEKQRLALVLFSIEGLPQKEVASIMECTVELVKWNVFQARKALKKKLSPYME